MKLQTKLFRSMAALAVLAAMLAVALMTGVFYARTYALTRAELRREARFAAAAVEAGGAPGALQTGASRVTHVAPDGTVLFDSGTDAQKMENHLSRPEIAQALQTGTGESARRSDTLDAQTLYCAVRLRDGSVLRISTATASVFGTVLSALPLLLLAAACAALIALFPARRLTRGVVRPINRIDPAEPYSAEAYEEFSPLLTRIARQNAEIAMQMRRLTQQRDEFSAITESMNEGLILLSPDGAVLSINRAAMRIFGQDRAAECTGRHITQLSRALPLQHATEALQSAQPCEERMETGGRIYHLLATPIAAADAPARGGVLLLLDVTERAERDELRREFSANVSHELKTPLTAISGYAEIMEAGLVKQEDMAPFAGKIHREATRLLHLIEDILRLSRLDEGAAELPRESVELLSLSQEICARLAPAAQARGVTLSASGEVASIQGVRPVLDELIYNLAENAVKYNQDGGTAEIAVCPQPECVSLSVRDTGIGIPPEYRDRIFERFFRVDKSHSKQSGGTGLGLSIVKHGAALHHAALRVDSTPGKGTCITVTFPHEG